MNQIKFYKFAIWGLLLLNIAVLTFLILTKPKAHHLGPPINRFEVEAIDILDLDSDQISIFRKLGKAHHQEMKITKEKQQKLLLSYFESLTTSPEGINKVDILKQFHQLESTKMEVTYQHFEEIKNLLRSDQKPHFNELMTKFIDLIVLEKKKNPHPPKDFE